MPTEIQTLAGNAQFTGLVNAGLFDFSTRFSDLPRSTRIVINSVSYTESPALGIQTNVRVQITRQGGSLTQYAIVGNGLAAVSLTSPINGFGELRLCGLALYRDPGDNGQFWDLQVFTEQKLGVATVAVDYIICPFPETDPRDSQR